MSTPITSIASFIRSKTAFEPQAGIILGTGLGGLADRIEAAAAIDYADIPGFPVSTVEGHRGRLVFGTLGGRRVVAMQGRFHYYEGYTPEQVVLPVRVMKLLGVERLLISNAAGGVDPELRRGDLMVITDHINLIPNPLIGPNRAEFGERFPNMARAYDRRMILAADRIGEERAMHLRFGCYVGLTGPSLETPAEYGFVRAIGGAAVGMSTTPEVIAAVHCGLPVFAVSVITNVAADGSESTHEAVQAEGARAGQRLTELIEELLRRV